MRHGTQWNWVQISSGDVQMCVRIERVNRWPFRNRRTQTTMSREQSNETKKFILVNCGLSFIMWMLFMCCCVLLFRSQGSSPTTKPMLFHNGITISFPGSFVDNGLLWTPDNLRNPSSRKFYLLIFRIKLLAHANPIQWACVTLKMIRFSISSESSCNTMCTQYTMRCVSIVCACVNMYFAKVSFVFVHIWQVMLYVVLHITGASGQQCVSDVYESSVHQME